MVPRKTHYIIRYYWISTSAVSAVIARPNFSRKRTNAETLKCETLTSMSEVTCPMATPEYASENRPLPRLLLTRNHGSSAFTVRTVNTTNRQCARVGRPVMRVNKKWLFRSTLTHCGEWHLAGRITPVNATSSQSDPRESYIGTWSS